MSIAPDVFELFVQGPSLLRQAVSGVSPEQAKERPIAGKWSIHEVVSHLVDSEQCWSHRIKRTIAEAKPLLIGYDESAFTSTLGYHDRDLGRELDLFELTRNQLVEILRGIPEASWSRTAVHTERGLVSVAEMVEIEAEHLSGHLVHVEAKRKALGI